MTEATANEAKLRDYLKRATSDLDRAQRRLGEMDSRKREPIAILGMSCRYPGGVGSPRAFWRLLEEGRDGIGEFPAGRGWDLERLYDPDPDSSGTSYAREGGFLPDAGEFDAEFFGIAPREALATDPQQRLLLEAAWQALEDGGIDPEAMDGQQAGVFVGLSSQDYALGMGAAEGELEGYRLAGAITSVASGRIAYTLGLQGPAITVDTACSSSLVATHLAAQALRGGECSLALAGGATVLGSPTVFTEFSRQRGLAPDGRSKAFAEAADGTGFSEGVGMLVLERLSDAERNNHPVLATIRGSAVNQDGASNGLTAPNGPSQERVIRQALANARLTPQDVDVVEAHGTGTTLGDPIEAGALLATYGQEREQPLRLGSVKSNIGHTQAAAGVAGVIKAVMAMREGVLPKSLHIDQPSTKVDWEAGKIELLTEAQEWEPNGRPRRAGVSSFGISGTNAHLILEEAPAPEASEDEPEAEPRPLAGPTLLPLSAKSPDALREQAARLAAHMRANPGFSVADLSYSLATTRSSFEHRAVAVGTEPQQLLASLDALAHGADAPGLLKGTARTEQRPLFLFPGQGAQFPGMAAELIEGSPSFARRIDQCEQALAPFLEWSLTEVLGEEQGAWLDRLDIVQPALFAVMVALAGLWRDCGVEPAVVVGHSQGEIAAAHVAGALSLPDAARVIALRAQAMAKIAGQGAMLSVSLPEAEIEARLEPYGERLSLAAVNGPASLVLSGEPEALAELQGALGAEAIRTQPVAVDYAAHSAQIEALEEELLEAFAPISPQSSQIPLHSTLTGEQIDTAQMDASYWYRNLRETVRLEPVLRSLLKSGQRTLIEIGPHPVLAFAATETAEAALEDPTQASVLASLRREEQGPERFALSLASAHAAGVPIQWQAHFKGTGAKAVPLPTYPFQRKRYWLDSSGSGSDPASIGQLDAEHPLLGAVIEDPGGEALTLTGRISLQSHPWLGDHAVAATVLLPGTAFLELALRAAEQAGAQTVEELTLQAPLILPASGAVQLQVSVSAPDPQGRREIEVHSRPEATEEEEGQEWACHAQGLLSPEAQEPPEPLGAWPPEGAEPLEAEFLYDRLAEAGFDYGPAFQGLEAAWKEGEEVYAEVSLPEEMAGEAERFAIHPALLDSALHSVALSASGQEEMRLPFAWSAVSVNAPGASALRVRLSTQAETASLAIADQSGAPVAHIGSLALRPIDPAQLKAQRRQEGLLGIEWQEVGPSQAEAPAEAFELPSPKGEGAKAAREATLSALERVKRHLAEDEDGQGRLAIITEGAVATGEGESPDPALAAAWGLIRSANSEHPGRFSLIDTDGSDASKAALEGALGAEAEPQLALREGRLLAPRATRLDPGAGEGGPTQAFDPEATVLITGATGGLGALIARHLVKAHGARHLLLASRSGTKAKGAKELLAELEQLGAKATIAAADVSDEEQLKELLGSIPKAHPLGAVIHAAGALDDATVESMGPEQLQAVFAPKADAAWALHELTAQADLSAFITFSSAAAALGGPGQGNYAAANSFCDALAQSRRAQGKPASSIAWGLWARESGMTSHLGEADLARMARSGIIALSDEQGLLLFDQALAASLPQALAIGIDRPGLRAMAQAGMLPPLLSGLVRVPTRRRSAPAGALAARLASLPAQEREAAVLELVVAEVATVLGHGSATAIEPERAFKDLGFDSLAAVELRNRLQAATGLRLAATTVFDYPNAAKLAERILAETSAEGLSKQLAVRATASDEPIAIIGMACRYPGGVGSPRAFWRLLEEGRDGITEFPSDRGWDLERLFDPDPDSPGTSYAREGGFVLDAAEFDAEFFEISPREALAMDPQQRLLLEAAWQALEDGGIDPASLRGSQAGVFAGVMYHDYGTNIAIPVELEGYLGVGTAGSVASGRIAYTLGLQGPAITVDTACSSSLVAMHLAAQALRGGECSLALTGGATILPTPGVFTEFSRQRGLAPDGRSKAFAEAADGTGFSEGVGMLVLERLSDAEANGHPILATIRGSAVNQDGASNGLTAPNGPSQERVIRQALANARLTPQDIDVVEAHGTGTTLGDPIEAGALLATYGQEREQPLRLGSVKSNIGHTQAAAGVAGVIKAVMAMREGVLPKSLHIDQPSTKVDWEAGQIELLTEAQEWEPNGRPRRAGVSSFGASGTNAHLILEEAPQQEAPEEGEGAGEPEGPVALPAPTLLPLSAKSPDALREQAARLAAHMRANPGFSVADLSYSLATTRSSFEHRAVAVGTEPQQLLASLDALAHGADAPGLLKGTARTEQRPLFLFPGQGAQFPGMAAELIEGSPSFARRIDQCEQALAPFLEWSLTEVLGEEQGAWLDRLDIVQPALFAVMVALAGLWRDCGVEPAVVVGHSQGEIAAAHVAGALSLPDAARVIALRAQAMAKIAGQGAMLSVSLPEAEIEARLEPYGERLSLAAVNGPASLVLSGEPEALAELQGALGAEAIRTQPVAVDYAAHSAQIEALEEELLEAFAPISPQSSQIPLHSTLTGEQIDTAQMDASYWYRNLRETVRLEPVLRSLLKSGQRTLIEIGPHPVLAFAATETAEAALEDPTQASVLASLRREEQGPERFALSLASAHAAGVPIQWQAHFKGTGAKAVPLPTYPFQRKRYWLDSSGSGSDPASIGQLDAEHPLLGAVIEDPGGEALTLTGRISLQSHPWLGDHAVAATVLLPGTAFLELALRAAEQAGAQTVEELTLQAPLILPASGAVQLQVSVSAPDPQGRREIEVHSRPEATEEEEGQEWACHAQGLLSPEAQEPPEPLGAWPPEGAEPLEAEFLYDRLAEAGFDYGPAFQGLEAAWKEGEEVYAEVSLPEEMAGEAERFAIHPALLDSALHSVALSASGQEEMRLPFAWSAVSVNAPGASALRVRLSTQAETASLAIADQSGAPVAHIGSLALRPIDPAQLKAQRRQEGLLGIEWQEVGPSQAEAPAEAFELPSPKGEGAKAAREATLSALERVKRHLAEDEDGQGRLAIITEGAVATGEGESPDPALAAAWGLIRSANSEHPGRFSLIDTDGSDASKAALEGALGAEAEPQLALREGRLLAPRALAPTGRGGSLLPPPGPWRLEVASRGSLEGLELLPSPAAKAPLGPTEVRVAMHAAGLNFRDVLIALGLYPGAASIGGEGAGVVVEVGPEVEDLQPGERVMGVVWQAFAPLAISERALLARVPDGWSFAEAAAVPTVFMTALYGLTDLAGLKAGERVLVHAGAGGVGMAAIQIARHLGAEVFATASPSKWEVLKAAGIPADHIASSRELDFREKFSKTTGKEGMDVVLNSLAGEFVDASLELLPRGGRFLEMGKTDIREAEQLSADHPGVSYRAYDLIEAGPKRLGEMLAEVLALFERGELHHSPITAWDMRQAPEAFRHLREGKNVGKLVLTLPRPIDPEATVLITGATGGLGALIARHLVKAHGARHLLLASRSGTQAKGAKELLAELEQLGAKATIAAADVSDQAQLKELLGSIPKAHPLGAVIHAAGALDDATVESMGPEQLQAVFAPKADAAWALHELTAQADLSAFITFSSAAAALGGPGQGNYAAANSFCDALAQSRRAQGKPASSIAWGLWARESGMTSHLGEADLARMARSGIIALSDEQGLLLFDQALAASLPQALAIGIDRPGLRAMAQAGMLPPLLSGLVRVPTRRRSAPAGALAARLASLPAQEREAAVLELVVAEVATVLGHGSATAIEPERAFKDLGFDSLAAVELRNRLQAATGLRLAATTVFDYPNAAKLAGRLLTSIAPTGEEGSDELETQERELRDLLASIPLSRLRGTGLLDSLIRLARQNGDASPEAEGDVDLIDAMDVEELIRASAEKADSDGVLVEAKGDGLND